MSHAPEPWGINPYVDAIDIVDAGDVIVVNLADRTIDLYGMPPDNARRIVGCVNACAGLSNDQVAAIPRLIAWFRDPNCELDSEEGYALLSLFQRSPG